MKKRTNILAIESSCDETSAAVISNDHVLSNIIASQAIHQYYGGVIPELASRAHQQKIIPVADEALKKAGISMHELDAIAFTRGPGLMGSLLVGVSFAKAFALALGLPLIEVNHMQAHVLAHFIRTKSALTGDENPVPEFPFLCLTVSGGHTQIVLVKSHLEMEVIGQTQDDAAGEAFDKAAKIMGLPYPGGPLIDKFAKEGNARSYPFPFPQMPGLDFSFSGLKTSFLYFIRDAKAKDELFIAKKQGQHLCLYSVHHCRNTAAENEKGSSGNRHQYHCTCRRRECEFRPAQCISCHAGKRRLERFYSAI